MFCSIQYFVSKQICLSILISVNWIHNGVYLIEYDRKSIRIRNSGKNKKLRKKLFCLSLQCCYSEHTVLLLLFCVQSLWQWINIWLPSADFATTSNLCCITFEDIRTTFTKPECKMAVLVVMQNVNVWNCFSFKLILVSLNSGQLCMVDNL